MNKLKKTNLLMMVIFTIISLGIQPAFAQQNHHKKGNGEGKSKPNKENIEAQKIAFITKRVNLTPEEAKVFWPVYNEYDAKRKDLKKTYKNNEFRNEEIETISEKEAEQMLDNQLNEAQKLLDLRKEYLSKFKAILPATKVLKLHDAERDFQKVMIDKLRNKEAPAPPMSPASPVSPARPTKTGK